VSALNQPVPVVDVIIEVPLGGFIKRGSTGKIDFISPLPCPFNYGSVPAFIGLEGDLLDAVVLGHRLPVGTKVSVHVWGAVGMTDQGLYDDKLICSQKPITPLQHRLIMAFFWFYAKAKSLLNLCRGRSTHNRCEGWGSAEDALNRATPRTEGIWTGPKVPF
jgi:inorganic pyrophosphatase